jgi:hypothetical protein
VVTLIPYDQVRWRHAFVPAPQRVDRAYVDGAALVVHCARKDEAVLDACVGESLRRLAQQFLAVHDEPGAFAARDSAADHVCRACGFSPAGTELPQHRARALR